MLLFVRFYAESAVLDYSGFLFFNLFLIKNIVITGNQVLVSFIM